MRSPPGWVTTATIPPYSTHVRPPFEASQDTRSDVPAEYLFFLPTFIHRIQIGVEQVPTRLFAHVRSTMDGNDSVTADVAIYDEGGNSVGEMLGYRAQRVQQKQSAGDLSNSYYQFRWEPRRLKGTGFEDPGQLRLHTRDRRHARRARPRHLPRVRRA